MQTLHTVSQKMETPHSSLYLHQIFTDFYCTMHYAHDAVLLQ